MSSRLLYFDTVFAHVTLWLLELHGVEAYSYEGEFTLTVLVVGAGYDSTTWLGQFVTWHIHPPDQEPRYFSGYIIRVAQISEQVYTLVVSSWLRFLSYSVECSSFIRQPLLAIVLDTWRQWRVAQYDVSKLSGQKTEFVPYSVRYNENALAFTSRLLANAGIFYWVDYSSEYQKIYLSDGIQAYSLDDVLQRFSKDDCIIQYSLSSQNALVWRARKLALRLGQLINIPHNVLAADNHATFLVHTIRHHAYDDSGLPCAVLNATGTYYENQVSAIAWQNKVHYPICPYPKPKMRGVGIGKVVGMRQRDVDSDPQGRVKVWFAWDQQNLQQDPMRCPWVSVRQVVAGDGCAVHFLPHVGHEVLVMYVDDDMEQPVVIGSVYNSISDFAFVWRQHSVSCGLITKQGHLLCMTDQASTEHFRLDSAGDFIQQIMGDHTYAVGEDKQVIIAGDAVLQILQESYMLQAAQRITLRCGTSVMTLSGVEIELNAAQLNFISSDSTLASQLKPLCAAHSNVMVNGEWV